MNRRGFLQAILAAGVAPYVSTAAGVLMPVRQRTIWLYGDGIHDDTEALQAVLNGRSVRNAGVATIQVMDDRVFVSSGKFLVTSTLILPSYVTIANSYFQGKQSGPLFESPHQETKGIVLHNNIVVMS